MTAPVARRAAIGFRPALTAAPEMTAGGRRYRFASWSNGGPRAQVFTVPDRTTDVVVRYVPVAPDAESADGAAADRPGTSPGCRSRCAAL